jgi:flagellar protein FliJ
MKAYRFRLDSVLRVRRLQERVATQQLAAAVRELDYAQTESARARRSLESMAAPAGRLTVGALQWAHAQSTRMSETASERAEAVEVAAEAARQANEAWGSAKQRTATLERLDERHVALWRIELERNEAAVLDDLATRRTAGEGGPL